MSGFGVKGRYGKFLWLLRGAGVACVLVIGAPAMAQDGHPPDKPVGKPAVGGKATAPTPPPVTSVTPPDSANLLSLPEAKPIRGMSWPALSPDGKTLCFTYMGDLWTVPSSGGTAIRLTVNEALDAYPRWSPDGKWIAFTSFRSGNPDVYLTPAEGGEARQVTFNSGSDWANGWSPDGTKLLFYGNGRDTSDFTLFSIDLRTRGLKQLTHDVDSVRFGDWSPSGKEIAYSRAGQPWWRPWYRGSQAAKIVIEDLETGKVHTVLKTNTQQFWPHYTYDGKSLYFVTIYGNSNTPNLYEVPVNGGTPRAITRYTTDAVRYPDVARNGSLLTYLYAGDLYTIRPDGTDARMVRILARSDDKVSTRRREVLHDHAEESELSPDNKTLALVIRGNIWLVPTSGGDATRLTDNTANNNDITWSPDGTRIAFISDMGNQPDVYTIDIKTKALVRLTNDAASESNPTWSPDGTLVSFAKAGSQPGLYVVPSNGSGPARRLAEGNGNNEFGRGIVSHTWSPDSKWVAFSRTDRYQVTDVWVVPAVGGTPVNITAYPNVNEGPRFTPDGKQLLFISDRDGAPTLFRLPLLPEGGESSQSKEVKIDFTDIQQRAEAIHLPGAIDDFAPMPDSRHIVVHAGGSYWGVAIEGGQIIPLTPGGEAGENIRITSDGRRFFYVGVNGTPRSLGLPPNPPGPPAVVAFTAELQFDRDVQTHQAFNEFYRKFGAAFYDGSLNGVDWPALRHKYEPLLEGVGTSWEFATVLQEMVGEVNSSHSEISPGDRPSGSQTATIGLTYDDSYSGPGLKVKEVLSKGPADQPSAHVYAGDYLLSIDGTALSSWTENYYQLLQDKEGKELTLLVNNKPTKEGARTIKVKPITLGEWHELDYNAQIQHRREEVERLSGGRLAYIHIQGMDAPSLEKFRRELYTHAIRAEGLVLDIRGNGGGNTHPLILQALSQHVYAYTQSRDAFRQTDPARAFTHPIVLLINENSYSDAEIFPSAFRALKLGKIVGVTTPGYVIGTTEDHLVDGTNIRLPFVGYYTADGKNMEELGIPPDITVENTPESIAAHRDRQLETAVQTLLKEIPSVPDKTASDDGTTVFSSATSNPNGGSSAVKPGAHPVRTQVP